MTRGLVLRWLALAGIAAAQTDPQRQTAPQRQTTIAQLKADGQTATLQAVVSVLDGRGSPVKELAASDFTAAIDGQAVGGLTAGRFRQRSGLSLVLAIDVSGSMRGEKINAARRGADRFLAALDERDYCALMTFGNQVRWPVEEFTNARQALQAKLGTLQAGDARTVLHEALLRAAQKAKGAPTPYTAIVVLTDGEDEGSNATLDQVIAESRANDVPVYTLGFGDRIDARSLARVATATGGRFQAATPETDLVDLYLGLVQQFSSQYLIGVPLRGVGEGSHSLTIGPRGSPAAQRTFEFSGASKEPSSNWPLLLTAAVLAAAVLAGWVFYRRSSPMAAADPNCAVCGRPLPASGGECPDCAAAPSPREPVWIEVVAGNRSDEVPFREDVVTLGRGTDRTISLEDKSVSREHAEIRRKNGRFVLANTQGRSGTFLKGRKIEIDEYLEDGDEIRLGNSPVTLIFHNRRSTQTAV